MIGATICSGIGAPEVACPDVDWQLASEIEGFPRAVLEQRFGYSDARASATDARFLWGDFTALRARHFARLGMPVPDLLVAGTPCQDFSIAGLRAGLAGDRGNLTLAYVRLVDAIDHLRRDRGQPGLIGVWENVPGIFSHRTNPFGCFLAAMAGSAAPLVPPKGIGWRDTGVVAGPRRTVAWRVLDAQYFGLAQRRERVFVVFGPGGWPAPQALLPVEPGLRRDTPPRREAGEEVAGTPGGASQSGGFRTTDLDNHGALIAGTVSSKWAKGSGGPAGDEVYNLVAHTLRADGFDASEDGTGRGPPLGAFHGAQDPDISGEVTHPIGGNYGQEACFAGATAATVRRITPLEAGRLQGFPDGHTAITYRGKPAADGPQYKGYGNAMAVPVMRWILTRVLAAHAAWLQERIAGDAPLFAEVTG